jgi:hypothetical protein
LEGEKGRRRDGSLVHVKVRGDMLRLGCNLGEEGHGARLLHCVFREVKRSGRRDRKWELRSVGGLRLLLKQN